MTIELKAFTVAELHAQLADLVASGHGHLPVCATDCRARYPFQAYTVPSPSGSLDALLIYVRPDAHFAQPDPLPSHWGPSRVGEWNELADEVKARCGAFADRHLPNVPSCYEMRKALEAIHESGHPDAPDHVPELRGITEAAFGDRLVRLAGGAIGRS